MEKEPNYFSVSLNEIIPDTNLTFNIHLFINNHFILYRRSGDQLDIEAFSKLQIKKVKFIFIDEDERASYEKYKNNINKVKANIKEAMSTPIGQTTMAIKKDLEKVMEMEPIEKNMESISEVALNSAKALVKELHLKPYSTKLISRMTQHSYGIYGHSVNVGTLAVHLAMKMGYTQEHFLEYLGSAGLLHDVGKIKININLINQGSGNYSAQDLKMLKEHPTIGRDLLLASSSAPQEVRLIVYQHHEAHDGTGYPEGLKGSKIYEPAKIVSIANTIDHLFQELKTKGPVSVANIVQAMNSKNIARKYDKATLERAMKAFSDISKD